MPVSDFALKRPEAVDMARRPSGPIPMNSRPELNSLRPGDRPGYNPDQPGELAYD